MIASELYAISQSMKNKGSEECHWCGSACDRMWKHQQPPPLPCVRTNSTAKRPASPWICIGCFRWRWKRTTINWLSGGLKDGLSPINQSWLITPDTALAIHPKERRGLCTHLLKPPITFTLCLLDDTCKDNYIHLAKINYHKEIKASTPLEFTLNNIPHTYTVYELDHALKNGPEGTEPGVQALLKFCGIEIVPETKEEEEKRGRGRPTKDESPVQDPKKLHKTVSKRA